MDSVDLGFWNLYIIFVPDRWPTDKKKENTVGRWIWTKGGFTITEPIDH